MKKVFIIRGLPGTGKSELANMIAYYTKGFIGQNYSYKIHTTDDFHMVNEEYIYDASKASEYHKKNFEAFEKSCKDGVEVVICPNTNINKNQYESYVTCARNYGYDVYKIIMDEFDVGICNKRTLHKMPIEIIENMKKNFEIEGLYEHRNMFDHFTSFLKRLFRKN